MVDKDKTKTTKKAEKAAPPEEEPTEGARSMADLAGTGGGSFEGELVTMESIEGKRHTFIDFKIMPSTFREGGTYACMSLKGKAKLAVCNSNAMVILKGLAQVDKAALPMPNAFVKRQGKKPGAKPYWDFASAGELKNLPWMP